MIGQKEGDMIEESLDIQSPVLCLGCQRGTGEEEVSR